MPLDYFQVHVNHTEIERREDEYIKCSGIHTNAVNIKYSLNRLIEFQRTGMKIFMKKKVKKRMKIFTVGLNMNDVEMRTIEGRKRLAILHGIGLIASFES